MLKLTIIYLLLNFNILMQKGTCISYVEAISIGPNFTSIVHIYLLKFSEDYKIRLRCQNRKRKTKGVLKVNVNPSKLNYYPLVVQFLLSWILL